MCVQKEMLKLTLGWRFAVIFGIKSNILEIKKIPIVWNHTIWICPIGGPTVYVYSSSRDTGRILKMFSPRLGVLVVVMHL